MSERLHKSEFIPPEERNLHWFKGKILKDIIEYLERKETDKDLSIRGKHVEEIEGSSLLDGFLSLLREKGVRVSTSEWMQFLTVIGKKTSAKDLKELVGTNEFLNKVRLFAKTTLVKDKSDESAFHEAFEEYFELAAKIYNQELKNQQMEKQEKQEAKKDETMEGAPSEIKEQLGIKEVDEKLNPLKGEYGGDEQIHGGEKDQHNDILRKADLAKQGGGTKKKGLKEEGDKRQLSEDKKKEETENGEESKPSKSPESEQQQSTKQGFLVGGGKGKSVFTERVQQEDSIIYEGEKLDKQAIQERKKRVDKVDRRLRYEERPDKASMREVIRNIRRIILDVSEVKSSNVDLKRTVGNFARRDFRFDYEREREKQPEIVLLIDVGGPVNEWSPLIKEVAEAMAEGLTKLEIYLFHNNLYGYVWKPDPKDLLVSSYAKPNSLIDIKSIIKRRKKVIIYGDAEMSYSEFESDGWTPSGNDERVEKFGMRGEECLNFIKRKADSVVWINPIFQKEWENRDNSGTIHAVNKIIPMYDLTIGGVEDAIKNLMKK